MRSFNQRGVVQVGKCFVDRAVVVLDDGHGDFKVHHNVQADRTEDSNDNSSTWLFRVQIDEVIKHLTKTLASAEAS